MANGKRKAGLIKNLLLSLPFLLSKHALAGDCKSIAGKITEAANRHQIKRVAVVPFLAAHGGETFTGSVIAERLVSHTAALGGLEVIERKLLKAVMREQKLESFGVIDPDTVKTLGKVLGVEAIVTGTVLELRNGHVEVNARLIDAQTAKVLAADITSVEKEWQDGGGNAESVMVPVPDLPDFDGLDMPRMGDLELPGVGNCKEHLDSMELAVVDLKAKYWAMRLHDKDFSLSSLKRNPGSEIENAGIRSRFYSQLKYWYGAESPRLSRQEMETLADQQGKIKRLADSCRS